MHRLSSESNANFSAVLLNIKASLVDAKSLLFQQKNYESLNLLKQTNFDVKLVQTLNPNFRDSKHIVFLLYMKGHVDKLMFEYKLVLRDFKECLDLVSSILGAKSEHTVLPLIEIVEVLIEMCLFDKGIAFAERCYESCHNFEVLTPDAALVLAKLHFASKTKQSYIKSSKYFEEWFCSINMDNMQESNANFQCVVANFELYILVLSK